MEGSMKDFSPDYRHIVDAAYNKPAKRLPLYEHNISYKVIELILGQELEPLLQGDFDDIKEYFRRYCGFCRNHGYDVVPFEGCVTELIQGGEGLCGIKPALIKDINDLEEYPWEEVPDRYFEKFDPYFEALESVIPDGMKAVAGVGNGVFELIQDFVPLTELAYLEIDNPDVFNLLWARVGNVLFQIWRRFLERYTDLYAVCRFGDDLGFKSSTLIRPDTIKKYIIPEYKKIISLIHSYGKPFLLHSCGSIFDVMEDILSTGIDAKHSNEDEIAPFSLWLEKYGDRIGNFGGIEMNVLCIFEEKEVREYVLDVLTYSSGFPGVAIGSGNQIADYIPPEGFIAMVETVRGFRGE
jgi:uroporphyrinogen decarboxylase